MRIRWRGLELPHRVIPDEETLTDTYGKFVIEPFERGFGTTVVSANSSRVECGTTLADPDDKPRTPRPRLDRPNPRGGRGR